MKIYTPTQKFFSTLSGIIISTVFVYLLVIVLFMNPATWMVNIVMFYMNFLFVIYFLGFFVDKETKKRMQKNKVMPYYIDAIYDFALAIMFAAAGWWYCTIISVVIMILGIGVFKKDDDDDKNN